MKTIVRAFVIALTLTGAVASVHTSTATAEIARPKASAMPIPMCPPDDPNGCGMGSRE